MTDCRKIMIFSQTMTITLRMKNNELISIYNVLKYEQTKKLCDVRAICIFLLAGRLDKLGR